VPFRAEVGVAIAGENNCICLPVVATHSLLKRHRRKQMSRFEVFQREPGASPEGGAALSFCILLRSVAARQRQIVIPVHNGLRV
jgi:hypothetical protein